MTRRPVRRVLLGAVGLFVVGACSGDDESTEATTTVAAVTTAPAAPTTTAPSTVDAYFGELAAPGAASEPPGGAVSDSDAAHYASHRANVSALLGTVGQPTVESAPDAVSLCASECVRFTAIESDPATGELVTFSVDGVPLAGRIASSGAPSTIDGVTLSISSAYANDDALAVVIDIDNGSAVDFEAFGFAATWLPSDGVDAIEATGTWGADVVPAGGSGRVLVTFAPAAPTGELAITGVRSDGFDLEFRLVV